MSGRVKGGRISLTAFELAWLQTILDTINPIEMDALEHVLLPMPPRVRADPAAAWDRLMGKIDGATR